MSVTSVSFDGPEEMSTTEDTESTESEKFERRHKTDGSLISVPFVSSSEAGGEY